MPAQEPTVGMTIRFSVPMTEAIDEKVAALEAANGTPFSRTDVIRMAVASYLGLVPDKPNLGDREQPQPTT